MATRADVHIPLDRRITLAKRMCANIAFALVAYTLMLIFMVSPALESGDMSIWPYFVLVALVAIVIPPCRNLERRWQRIEAESGYAAMGQFHFERLILWACAFGIPIGLTAILRTLG